MDDPARPALGALRRPQRGAGFAGDRQARGAEAFVQGNFGLAALLTGDTDVAEDAFREELRLCGELVVRSATASPIVGPTDSGDGRDACNGGAGTDTATLCERIARMP